MCSLKNFVFLSIVAVIQGAEIFCTDHEYISNYSSPIAYTIDDHTLSKLANKIELLSSTDEILRLHLGIITTRMEYQSEILRKLNENLLEQTYLSKDPSPFLPSPPKVRKYPSNCVEATEKTHQSGIYAIQVDLLSDKPFLVSCNNDIQGGRWTVIQRRQDGSIDFFRKWADYKVGFGNLNGEFFIGLDKLHALTTERPQELLILMTDFDTVTRYAKYTQFAIGDESEGYALKVLGSYSGDAGDSLSADHAGQKFTTQDRKNDVHTENCAAQFKGAWWYKKCHRSNLNGLYLKGNTTVFAQGVVWYSWHGHYYSLKTVEMLIRPKGN